MLKFLSKVRFEFNALDPRTACCMEFLAQCNAARHKELNPGCQILVKRRTDDHPPEITITYVNGVEERVDATSTTAQSLRERVVEKGQMLSTEQMFREAGEKWPVVIPEEELSMTFPGTKECDRAVDVDIISQEKLKKRASECEIKIKMKYFG